MITLETYLQQIFWLANCNLIGNVTKSTRAITLQVNEEKNEVYVRGYFDRPVTVVDKDAMMDLASSIYDDGETNGIKVSDFTYECVYTEEELEHPDMQNNELWLFLRQEDHPDYT